MTSSLIIDHKKMHDIKSAAEASGYSRDHIASLARAKKIVATQVGRQWYVDLDSLTQYANVTALEQQVRQKHLSEERKLQKELSEKISDRKKELKKANARHNQKAKTTTVAMASLALLMLGGLATVSDSLFLEMEYQTAASKTAALSYEPITTTLLAAEESITRESTSFSDGSVEIVSMAAARDAIVILPELSSSTASMFSDDVVVAETARGERVLVPNGRSVEDGVPFTVLPITETSRL